VIWIDSSGPILHRRKRYNSNNIEFGIFEFRTTPVDQRETAFNCMLDETRFISGFGQILRRSGIDKLPLLQRSAG
jgi:lipopolysaccharide/colanic/teichoic acid biosynthesis glycosyltransferase